MTDDYDSVAEMLADMTGRPKEVFEYDGPIPDFDEQEIVFPDDE